MTTTQSATTTIPQTKPDDRQRPVPQVKEFDGSNANIDEVVAAVIEAGACVIRNAVSIELCNKLEAEMRPFLDLDGSWDGTFFPRETRRVMGLAGKSPLYMKTIVQNPIYQAVTSKLLTSEYSCWVGNTWKTTVSKPQLNNTATLLIGPGARDQELHRDSMIHHLSTKSMEAKDYKIAQDTGIGFFVAGKRATKQNGATRLIPGSHLWDISVPPEESMCVYPELETGDAFICLSSVYHGGSANKTTDEERLLFSCFMIKGFLRQEENQYVANSFDEVKDKYDDETLELIGYNISSPFLGWIDALHPLQYLRGDKTLRDLF